MKFNSLLPLIAAVYLSGCGSELSGLGSNPPTKTVLDQPQGGSGSSKPVSPAPQNPSPVSPPPPAVTNPPSLSLEAKTALDLVNAARAQARNCGDAAFPGVSPLTWNNKLEAAARVLNQDMISNQFFDHVSPNGSTPATRVLAQGYDFARVGENIAVGSLGSSVTTVAGAIKGWLASPGHCKNIMNGNFTEMGLASANGQWGQYDAVYWTQNFGKPR
jgi:uncharacterized protein YkwD